MRLGRFRLGIKCPCVVGRHVVMDGVVVVVVVVVVVLVDIAVVLKGQSSNLKSIMALR